MADFDVIDENNFDDDALRHAIKSYKEAMRRPHQDLDVAFFIKTLQVANGLSCLKIARNPVNKDHQWNPDTILYNVGKVEVDEEHHLVVRIRKDGVEHTVEKMLDEVTKLKRKLHGLQGPVMLALSDEKKVQITDIYSHAFVEDHWAGLPFDVVLGYFEDDPIQTETKREPQDELQDEA